MLGVILKYIDYILIKTRFRTPPGGFAATPLYEGGYFASLSEGGAPKGRREFSRCLYSQNVADRVKSTLVLSTRVS